MRFRIVMRDRGDERRWEFDQDRVVVGRDGGCEVVVRSPYFARKHFVFERDAAGFHVTDLGSSGGTFLNRERTLGRTPLRAGIDRISPGSPEFRIEWCDVTPRRTDEGPWPLPHAGEAVLLVEDDEGVRKHRFTDDRLTFGRDAAVDLHIASELLPRRAGIIERRFGLFYVHDLGTPNGMRLGDEPLAGGVLLWRGGDERLTLAATDARRASTLRLVLPR